MFCMLQPITKWKDMSKSHLVAKSNLLADSVITGPTEDKFQNVWIYLYYYKRTYESVPQTWLLQSLAYLLSLP